MTQEELDRLTPEEKGRLEAAEQEALKVLSRQMREGRWYPRRHMRFAFFVLFGLGAIYFLVLGVVWLVETLLRR